MESSLREGWVAFKLRPGPIVAMLLAFSLAGLGLPVLTGLIFGEKGWQASLMSVVIQFLFMIFYPGFQAYALKAVRRDRPDWGDFFWGWKYPVRIFTADILSTLPLLVALLVGGVALALVNGVSVPEAGGGGVDGSALRYFKYATLGVLGAALVWVLGYIS